MGPGIVVLRPAPVKDFRLRELHCPASDRPPTAADQAVVLSGPADRLLDENGLVSSIGSHTIAMVHGTLDRPYLLHVPPTPTPDRMPLILELHGRGIGAEPFDRLTGFRRLADEAGFALALPSGVNEVWNDRRSPAAARVDDVGYLAAVIDDVAGRVPIDGRRIYVVGMSNGAAMAGRLACELTDRIAAVVQVAGTAAVDVVAACQPGRPLPILQIHGSADRYARYDGRAPRGLITRAVIRRRVGRSLGVDAWAQFWVQANGAANGPVVESIWPDTTVRRWHGATPASDVVFYRIEGGGHTWPGSDFNLPRLLFGRTSQTFSATRVSWAFLAAHSRPD
jgi:polyhydroxybutyrate depolymerase